MFVAFVRCKKKRKKHSKACLPIQIVLKFPWGTGSNEWDAGSNCPHWNNSPWELLCAPSKFLVHPTIFQDSKTSPMLTSSSSFSFFTHHSCCSLLSFSLEVVIHSCVILWSSAFVTVVRWQMVVVVVVGVAINDKGTLNFSTTLI